MEASSGYERIYRAVAAIPRGSVMSYGAVARAAGYYRGARLVGWALKALPPERTATLPWYRVVNREGVLSISHPALGAAEQAGRLRADGVEIIEENGTLKVSNPTWHVP